MIANTTSATAIHPTTRHIWSRMTRRVALHIRRLRSLSTESLSTERAAPSPAGRRLARPTRGRGHRVSGSPPQCPPSRRGWHRVRSSPGALRPGSGDVDRLVMEETVYGLEVVAQLLPDALELAPFRLGPRAGLGRDPPAGLEYLLDPLLGSGPSGRGVSFSGLRHAGALGGAGGEQLGEVVLTLVECRAALRGALVEVVSALAQVLLGLSAEGVRVRSGPFPARCGLVPGAVEQLGGLLVGEAQHEVRGCRRARSARRLPARRS